jgi:hypothetical protein
VLAIVDGLDEDLLTTPALPSGWTPLGLIEHLGHAERRWFQGVALGSAAPLPWPEDPAGNEEGEDAPYTTSRPPEVVFAFCREQIGRASAVVATTPLSAHQAGRRNREGTEHVTDLRTIMLHMIEETARHAGHLDAARELLDGRTGIGPR